MIKIIKKEQLYEIKNTIEYSNKMKEELSKNNKKN